MPAKVNRRKSKNLLSIDGGTNALTALSILGELTSRRQFDSGSEVEVLPAEQFDMIVATGPGALVAILIGTLRLPIVQAMEAYATISNAIPAAPAKDDEERQRNTEIFEKAFEQVLNDANFPKDRGIMNKAEPKIIICTSNIVDVATLYPVRSYRVRRGFQPHCTITQVALASIAYPDRFLPVILGSGDQKVMLIDATLSWANPTKELLREAQAAFGADSEVGTLVSIGSGKVEVGVNELPKKGWSISEQVHKELQRQLQETNIYYRFNVENDLGGERRVAYARIARYLDEETVTKRLDEVLQSLQARPKGPKLKEINSVSVIQIELPPRPSVVQNFIGRRDTLEAMFRTHITEPATGLQVPPTTVLYGIGGSGKTQTALKFALDFETSHSDALIFFLNASSKDSVKADLETLIRSRGAEYRTKSFQDALVYLAKEVKNWLVIMDNADDPSVSLLHFIPKCAHGNVIITTRNSNHRLLAPNSYHHIEALPTNEAVDLLLTSSANPKTEENIRLADDIVRALGYLPLAIVHAGGYIFVNECLSTYLRMYSQSKKLLLSSSSFPLSYSHTVATTVQMSLKQLPQSSLDLMLVLSHLDCRSISHEIIVRAATGNFIGVVRTGDADLSPLTMKQATALRTIFTPRDDWLEAEFNLILNKCLQYSLLRLTAGNGTKFYSMHVLVQAYIQTLDALVRNSRPRHLMTRLLGSSIIYDTDTKHIGLVHYLVPHIKLVDLEDVVEGGDCFGFGTVFWDVGDSKRACIYWEKCAEIWSKSLGEGHKNTLAAMTNVAMSYHGLGNIAKAMELEEIVLEVQRAIYGTEDRDTLSTMNNLGTSYNNAARYDEALPLHEEVAKIRAQILGPEDPETLVAMCNVAQDYRLANKYQEAFDIETKVLEIQKRVLGPESPDTLGTMGNLSASLALLKRRDEAIDMTKKVVEAQKRVLGSEHPQTMRSISNLSLFYCVGGMHEESLELNEPVLEWQKETLGLEHPHTLFTMRSRLQGLEALHRKSEFNELLQIALTAHEKSLGMEHPTTIRLKEDYIPLLDAVER